MSVTRKTAQHNLSDPWGFRIELLERELEARRGGFSLALADLAPSARTREPVISRPVMATARSPMKGVEDESAVRAARADITFRTTDIICQSFVGVQ